MCFFRPYAANCPTKDKCSHCGATGHFARDCPTPWGNAYASNHQTGNSNAIDFPPLNPSSDTPATSAAFLTNTSSSSAQPAASSSSAEGDIAEAGSSNGNTTSAAPTNPVFLMSISVPPPPSSPTPSSFSVDSGLPIAQFSTGPSDDSYLHFHAQDIDSDPTQFSPPSSPLPIPMNCDSIDNIETSKIDENNGAKGTDNVMENESNHIISNNIVSNSKTNESNR